MIIGNTIGGYAQRLRTVLSDTINVTPIPYFYPFTYSTEDTISYRKEDWHGNVFTSTVNATFHGFNLIASHVGQVRLYIYRFAAEFTKTGDIFDGQFPYFGTQLVAAENQWLDVVVGENSFVIDIPITGSMISPQHYWMGLRTINVGTLGSHGILRSLGISPSMPFTPVNGIELRDARSGSTNFDYYSQGFGHNFYYFYNSSFILT